MGRLHEFKRLALILLAGSSPADFFENNSHLKIYKNHGLATLLTGKNYLHYDAY
jgi:hypothetical protein